MNRNVQLFNTKIHLFILVFLLFFAGCGKSPETPQQTPGPTDRSQTDLATPTNLQDTDSNPEASQNQAIAAYRAKLGLPQLPLSPQGTDLMANAPSGSVSVAVFADTVGRLYKVELTTNRVIEIDARALLNTTPNLPVLPVEELRALAFQYANALIPNFEERQASLSYQEGDKGEVFFFVWTSEGNQNMPPQLQIGLDQYGHLFALIDTLPIED